MSSTRSLFSKSAALLLAAACVPVVVSAREPARRIHADLGNDQTFALEGSVSPRIVAAADMGTVDAGFSLPRITIHFQLTAAQNADLEALLKRQQNSESADFHKWLTPETFASRYGLAAADLEKVTSWLESRGFTVLETARTRTWVAFSGTGAQVESAFGTSIHRYQVNGTEHFANADRVALPIALRGVAGAVRGLTSFRPHPRLTRSVAMRLNPHFTSSISGNHFLAPDDFATIYDLKALYGAGIDGTGQKIAVAGQTDIDLADIRAFRQAAGLPANDPQIVLDGTDPGTSTSDLSEADLDLEWAGAIARQATIIYVNSSDAFTSALYAVDNNLAPVLSISYGVCEAQLSASDRNTLVTAFQQANAQGITIVAAGGDSGAADCDSPTDPTATPVASATHGLAVDAPGSLPYVTSMGGTTLTEGGTTYWNSTNNSGNGSAISYIPEVAWNDTSAVGELSASGGGASSLFAKPSWQLGVNVPQDGHRDVPDIALAASPEHDGYLICSGGSCVNGFRDSNLNLNVVGGASIAAPSFAAVVALIDQQTKTSQGNVNPGLYSLASVSSNAFHDITVGNNIVPCTAGSTGCPAGGTIGYFAGVGYDQVTGLGSIDGYNLVTQWGSDFGIAISPTTLTVNVNRSNTATVQISKLSSFNGTVSFTCSVAAPLTQTTCSVPGTVTGSGTATLTVTNTGSGMTTPRLRPPGGTTLIAISMLLFAGTLVLLAYIAPRRWRPFWAGIPALLLLGLLGACDDGGSSSSNSETQTAVTGNVTVTATSGIESHAATISVTVP